MIGLDMQAWLDQPPVQSALAPFLCAALVGAVGLAGRGGAGALAGTAVTAGVLTCAVLLGGWPHWPPASLLQRLQIVALGLPVLALWLDVHAGAARLRSVALVVLPPAAALWLLGALEWHDVWASGSPVALLAASMVGAALARQAQRPLVDVLVVLCAAAILAVCAVVAGSLLIAQLAAALASACAGVALAGVSALSRPAGAGLLAAALTLLTALAVTALTLTPLVAVALAPLLALPLVAWLATALARRRAVTGSGCGPMPWTVAWMLLGGLVVGLASTLLALLGMPVDDAYYR